MRQVFSSDTGQTFWGRGRALVIFVQVKLDGDVYSAVLQGSAAAAFVVARPGCASAMPDKQQLEDFMLSHAMTEPKKKRKQR